jgi:galactokinase
VNLIGEHTDYNEGLALPFAISDGVTVRATRTDDDRFQVVAADLDSHDSFALDAVTPVVGWRAFARGAVGELSAAGCPLVGARLEITGTVPRGSGLSSSAALEVALCLALLAVADVAPPERLDLAARPDRVALRGARERAADRLSVARGHAGGARARRLRAGHARLRRAPRQRRRRRRHR